MELVERDAFAAWWYSRAPRPEADVTTSSRPVLRDAVTNFARLGRELRFIDLTHDLGLPVIAAVTWMKEGRARIALTAGCHFDPEIAASRALTELGQWLRNFELAERDENLRLDGLQDFLFRRASLEDFTFLRTDAERRPLTAAENDGDELKRILEVSDRAGLELIVRNVSRAEFDFPVVKVMVPGLAMHWPRFGHRRLYDVPARLGWLPGRLDEDRLNPQSWS